MGNFLRFIALLFLLLIVTGADTSGISFFPEWFGKQDFIQYWSAFHLLLQGENPYDAQAMLSLQQKVLGPEHLQAVMMWNPPALLAILAPVLLFHFELSNQIWIAINFLFLFGCVAVAIALVKQSGVTIAPRKERLIFLLGGMFYPAWNCISSGQIGLLLAVAVSLALLAILMGRDLLAGAMLAVLTVKPHLFYLFGALIFLWCVRAGRWRILVAALLWFLALNGILLLFNLTIIHDWIHALSHGVDPRLAVPIGRWRVETLLGWLRGFGIDYLNLDIWRVLLWIPITGILGVGVWFFGTNKGALSPDSLVLRQAPLMLCLSIACAPYGWFSDYAALIPPFALMIGVTLTSQPLQLALLFMVLFTQIAFLVSAALSSSAHSYIFVMAFAFFWLGTVILPRTGMKKIGGVGNARR